jgi:hypothetical protein
MLIRRTVHLARVGARRYASTEAKLIRFRAHDGDEHFGTYADADELSAYVAKPGTNGKMAISKVLSVESSSASS